MLQINDSEWVKVYFSGATEPINAKAASGAAILDLPNGKSILVETKINLSSKSIAEYIGCLIGLAKASSLGFSKVKLYSDSQLVIFQLKGLYKAKASEYLMLFSIIKILSKFHSYKIELIDKKENERVIIAAKETLNNTL